MKVSRNTQRMLIGAATVAIALPAGIAATSSATAATSTTTAKMLQSMVAEEKLSHDVYTALGSRYDVMIFKRIASSESTHQAALRAVMTANGVIDLTSGDPVGKFDDPAVQELYDDLVAQGSVSLSAAMQVGVTIEKLDIADLDTALAANPAADVTAVLDLLRAGSERHLAAFSGDNMRLGMGQGMGQGMGNRR